MTTSDLRQPVIEHLRELRDRLIRAGLALAIGMGVGFIFARGFLELLIRPLGGESQLQVLRPTESILIYFKAALILGAILATPVILYEIVAFVAPALSSKEKRLLAIALPLAGVLFAVGIAFASFVVLPFTLSYLQQFLADLFKADYAAGYYLSFVLNFTLWIGIAFELPLLIALLSWLGLVSPARLRSSWRYAIVIIGIAAAVITPTPDPFTMAVVMVPLLALYILGIILARFTYRSRIGAGDES